LALTTLQLTEQELGARGQCAWKPVVFDDGHARRPLRRLHIAGGGLPHAAAAGADGEHPGTVPPAAVAFQGLDERLCLGAAAPGGRAQMVRAPSGTDGCPSPRYAIGGLVA